MAGNTAVSIHQPVSGVFTVHLKAIKLADEEAGRSLVGRLRLMLSVGDRQKSVPVTEAPPDGANSNWLVCDAIRHFSVSYDMSTNASDYNFSVDLLMNSPLLQSDSTLGTAKQQIVTLIQETPTTDIFPLYGDEPELPVAYVDLSCVFSFGAFGYGEGLQICSSQRKPEDYLKWSAFPRITSHEEHTAIFSHPIDSDNHPLQDIKSLPHSSLINQMKNLSAWKLQHKVIRDRNKRLDYLRDIVRSDQTNESKPMTTHVGITLRGRDTKCTSNYQT